MEISSLLDSVGGEMNAFTSKEHTCFYARVLDRDLPLAIDVISDIVTSALLRPEDVDAERGVILEEIAMRDDDPSDLVHDEFMLGMYGETDLGRSILGTHETIAGISRDAIASFYRERYKPHAMVVSAAGAVDHDEVVRLVTEAFRSAGRWAIRPSAASARRGGLTSLSLVHDEFMLGMYGETDLGRSILGTHETIAGISRDAIASFYHERYKPHAMVVSAPVRWTTTRSCAW